LSSARVFYPELNREGLVLHLRPRLARLDESMPLARAVLFGSWANGRATASSDVDLLVIYRGRSAEKAYPTAWKVLQLPRLELHLYSEADAERMQQTIARMTEGGITLFPGPDATSGS
jgi:predicted nucleotidyltransferase